MTEPSRLPAVKWSDRLAFEVALLLEGSGETLNEVLERHELGPDELMILNTDTSFTRQVSFYRTEVREKGMTFRLKARAQAEELLTTSWGLIHDPSVSPAVRSDLIKSTVKWAGLDSGPPEGPGGGSSGVKITINIGGQTHDVTSVAHLPPAIELDDADYAEEDM